MRVFDEWEAEILSFLQRGQSRLKPNTSIEELAEQILTQIEGVLLLSRLYKNHNRLQRGFINIRQTLNNALLEPSLEVVGY